MNHPAVETTSDGVGRFMPTQLQCDAGTINVLFVPKDNAILRTALANRVPIVKWLPTYSCICAERMSSPAAAKLPLSGAVTGWHHFNFGKRVTIKSIACLAICRLLSDKQLNSADCCSDTNESGHSSMAISQLKPVLAISTRTFIQL